MKLIQQSKLYFKEGKSDKVYEIDLCQLSDNEYIVNFRYGRRGSALKAGTKTPEAVSRDKAESIFTALEEEKRKKGYQPEVEVATIELPPMEMLNPNTPEGVILQRLQDAVSGKKSYKTEWKTSRVIWKAGEIQLKEAIPFILRLATQGSEMQTYASLWALIQLQADSAEPLFRTIAAQTKQKAYIRHIACEGLLSILTGDELTTFVKELKGKAAESLTYRYLVCRVEPELLSGLHSILSECKFAPPFFRHIRAIYKLAQIRKDFATVALLSYRLEKENPMFRRTHALDSRSHQFIASLSSYLRVGNEIKSEDSKIAFSQYTKAYLQRNSLDYLRKAGKTEKTEDTSSYISLAVSTLLQYSEKDHKKAEERPQYEYGVYNYKEKLYYYTLINYSECYDSLLLSTILFGNDTQRKLQKNLTYIYGKRTVVSQSYWYQPDKVFTPGNFGGSAARQENNKSIIGAIKNLFGGKKQPEPVLPSSKPDVPETPAPTDNSRPELYPELWDKNPEVYIQLLLEGKMEIIHRFAYNNLKEHTSYQSIINKITSTDIVALLNREYETPNKLGFELLKAQAEKISKQPELVARILNSNSAEARNWAQSIVNNNTDFYLRDFDFIISLIANTRKENESWIDKLLQKSYFTDERLQAILGKLVIELLALENNDENNTFAKAIINRINIIAIDYLSKISWDIVEQLILSPLANNMLLASSILKQKSQRVRITEIPVSIADLFMRSEIEGVCQNGIQLMNLYPDNFLVDNYNFVLNQIDSYHREVVENTLNVICRLISEGSLGDATVRHFNYALIRKEKFEGSHELLANFMCNELKPYWYSGLSPKDITKLIHAQYRRSQLVGYEILNTYNQPDKFTIGQIVSFGNHELLAVRIWCWNYFSANVKRIRFEKDKALNLLDSQWDDTREFACVFFRKEFSMHEWTPDTLIGVIDSIRPDIQEFGLQVIGCFIIQTKAMEYLSRLAEHPSMNVQTFMTNYLNLYVAGKTEAIRNLEYYFRSVLTRVNKARVAKNRILKFLHQEALRSADAAEIIAPIIDDMSAQSTIQDKATCIDILTEIRKAYPHLDTHLIIKN